MSKGRKCIVIANARNGYCCTPKECQSIAEAVRFGKEWFAYRIYDTSTNRLIKRGFGD